MTQRDLTHPDVLQPSRAVLAAWDAVSATALCVAEFMPVSFLSPIATDLGVTEGRMGQAISISGTFAVLISLSVSNLARLIDRCLVLSSFSLILVASGLSEGAGWQTSFSFAAAALAGSSLLAVLARRSIRRKPH
ncbi:hypothetical protein [Rhizobium multihospitium]